MTLFEIYRLIGIIVFIGFILSFTFNFILPKWNEKDSVSLILAPLIMSVCVGLIWPIVIVYLVYKFFEWLDSRKKKK